MKNREGVLAEVERDPVDATWQRRVHNEGRTIYIEKPKLITQQMRVSAGENPVVSPKILMLVIVG